MPDNRRALKNANLRSCNLIGFGKGLGSEIPIRDSILRMVSKSIRQMPRNADEKNRIKRLKSHDPFICWGF